MTNPSAAVSVAVIVLVVVGLWLIGRAGVAATVVAAPLRTPDDPQRPAAASRTQIKWLINTGNLAGRWPPQQQQPQQQQQQQQQNDPCAARSQCPPAVVAPNTVTRLQMIHGGHTAVLVMPTGDGGRRCCAGRVTSLFSLASVRLDHGANNLYPVVRPFPDWRAFVQQQRRPDVQDSPKGKSDCRDDDDDACSPEDPPPQPPQPLPRQDSSGPQTPRADNEPASPKDADHDRGAGVSETIVNAVDAFLDDSGRILWVLDTGGAGEDACYGKTAAAPPVDRRNSTVADEDFPPKFLAIDVHTNRIISAVSLSRVWKPGVSCFQYIVAIYSDTEFSGGGGRGESGGRGGANSTGTTSGCVDWPLVVIGDAGTNHLQVYTHRSDKFTEIMLPFEEENAAEDEEDVGGGVDETSKGAAGESTTRSHKSVWPATPIRDILYVAPLHPRPGHSCLLITYHGCRDVYNLRLQPSTEEDTAYTAAAATDKENSDGGGGGGAATPAPPAPVTGTLTVIGRKPCRMIVLGTDRRRTDVTGGGDDEGFAGGGTTVYFRLENTNDIWSWNTADKRKYTEGASFLSIDERHFRLVRPGRTCRVPIAVSVAPAVVASKAQNKNKDGDDDDNVGKRRPTTTEAPRSVRQIVWMLETNFVDHFAGTADRLGVNAKLQPLEEPLYGSGYNDTAVTDSDDSKQKPPPPLPVQPGAERRRFNDGSSRTRCFQRVAK